MQVRNCVLRAVSVVLRTVEGCMDHRSDLAYSVTYKGAKKEKAVVVFLESDACEGLIVRETLVGH